LKILVTGGAGFIGSNFVRRVVDGSLTGVSSLTVLDKLTYAGTLTNLTSIPGDSFEFIQGDICDVELVNELAATVDAIINFAAESHVDRSITSSSEFVRTNVLGTQVLLDAAKNNQVRKFVQVSTDEVYGSILEGSWDEDEPLLPNSPYSASKAAADLLVRAYFVTHGLNINVTRCSNNFGPRQDPEKLIPNFILKLNQNKKVPIYGDGLNVRDWIYVSDHCLGIYLTLIKGVPGEIYNIGGGEELRNLDLTKKLLALMKKDDSFLEFVEDRLGHDRRYSVDSTKIEKLGYTSKMDFEGNLRKTVAWYLDNFDSIVG
jgi:dTDP-glucose 4,6-dehydratase